MSANEKLQFGAVCDLSLTTALQYLLTALTWEAKLDYEIWILPKWILLAKKVDRRCSDRRERHMTSHTPLQMGA